MYSRYSILYPLDIIQYNYYDVYISYKVHASTNKQYTHLKIYGKESK